MFLLLSMFACGDKSTDTGNEDTMERTLVKNNLYKLYEAGLIKIIEEELIEDTTTSKNGLD